MTCESFINYTYDGEEALESGMKIKRCRIRILFDKLNAILKTIMYRIQTFMSKNIDLIIPKNVGKAYSDVCLKWIDALDGKIPHEEYVQCLINVKDAVSNPSPSTTRYVLSSMYRQLADLHKFITKISSPDQITNKYFDGKIDDDQFIKYLNIYKNAKTNIEIINVILSSSKKVPSK